MTRVTLDTGVLPAEDLLQAARHLDCDFAVVSVTERELEGTRFEVHLEPLGKVPETGVYGESHYGRAVYASEPSADALGKILHILSSGSFPKSRDNLSGGQRHHLRDALILEAHIREGRDILVTTDERAYIKHCKREQLEALFKTRIRTRKEFLADCAAGAV